MYHTTGLEPDRRRSYTGLLPPCKEFGTLPEEVETETGSLAGEDEEFHSVALEAACEDLRKGSIDEELISLTLLVPQVDFSMYSGQKKNFPPRNRHNNFSLLMWGKSFCTTVLWSEFCTKFKVFIILGKSWTCFGA